MSAVAWDTLSREERGRACYADHCRSASEYRPGVTPPAWESLPPHEQEAWRVVGEAASHKAMERGGAR